MKGLREVGNPRTQYRPDNVTPQKPSYRCPYCGKETTFSPVKWTYEHWIARCDNGECKRIFYAKVDYRGTVGNEPMFDVIETYPKYVPKKHESIPDHIWSDYLEACNCFDVGSFKATVVMCRRMLQNICLEKGAKKTKENGYHLETRLKRLFLNKTLLFILLPIKSSILVIMEHIHKMTELIK